MALRKKPNGQLVRATESARGCQRIVGWRQRASGGHHRRTAEYLLAQGADMNWIPQYAKQPPVEIAATLSTGRESLIKFLRDNGAQSSSEAPEN